MARLTLTFDNGPEPVMTHHVLDVLTKFDIKASFFFIGRKLAVSPDARKAAERAKAEGHWIGNHSYNHIYSLGDIDRADAFDSEVIRTFEVLGDLAHPDLLFRPFCNAGIMDSRVFKQTDVKRICDSGYTCVLFNSVPRDWEDRSAWLPRALADLDRQPWTTIVLHDIVGYPEGVDTRPMLMLEDFILRAKAAGHEIVQEFSPDCLPIVKGKMHASLNSLSH